MLAYPCRFEPASQWDADDVGFVVTCRDLPEVATQGDDMGEAMAMAVDAIATVLSACKGPGFLATAVGGAEGRGRGGAAAAARREGGVVGGDGRGRDQ